MVLFQPHKNRLTYSKQYLYKEEEQYFEKVDLKGQMNRTDEGLLIYDTDSDLIKETLKNKLNDAMGAGK